MGPAPGGAPLGFLVGPAPGGAPLGSLVGARARRCAAGSLSSACGEVVRPEAGGVAGWREPRYAPELQRVSGR